MATELVTKATETAPAAGESTEAEGGAEPPKTAEDGGPPVTFIDPHTSGVAEAAQPTTLAEQTKPTVSTDDGNLSTRVQSSKRADVDRVALSAAGVIL